MFLLMSYGPVSQEKKDEKKNTQIENGKNENETFDFGLTVKL